ncbi:MAG: hypothetical protein ACJA14_000856, partial [Ilumatobacter sp.]
RLPAPNVTATAAPTAAQRDRHARERTRVVIVIVVCPISWSAQTQNRTQDPNPHTPTPATQTKPDTNQPNATQRNVDPAHKLACVAIGHPRLTVERRVGQMFVFTATTPEGDSSLDPGVIVHEYAHGLPNRLTGG